MQYLRSRLRSFRFAFQGIYQLFVSQPNAQIHLLATVVIVAIGFWLKLAVWEWCAIVICIALVLLVEALNTAIEYVVDLVSPEPHPLAGKAKDVAAGAVLMSVIICGIVWGVIYLPKLWLLLV